MTARSATSSTSSRTETPMTYRPILHVHIVDDLTGDLLADVDAASTADGLAYYLRSRRLDEKATERSVWFAAGYALNVPDVEPDPADTIVREERNPISGAIESAIFAEVGGS